MLTIEKTVKLLDDFHLDQFREFLKEISIRSYYPLALVDVIDRDFRVEQDSDELYQQVYGEKPTDEKDRKKFFQLAYHTFRQTSFLAKNYPDYLSVNLPRIQKLINTGELEDAITLADILRDVAEKVEDYSTLAKVLHIQARASAYLGNLTESLRLQEEISGYLTIQSQISNINGLIFSSLERKGKVLPPEEYQEMLNSVTALADSEVFSVRLLARLNVAYLRYLHRDPVFFTEENFALLQEVEQDAHKNEHIILPFLYNLLPKVHFLKMHYLFRQLDSQRILEEARQITEEGKSELFWHSFINLPELNSITIQCSHLVSNYFYSYRPDRQKFVPPEIGEQIEHLIERCEQILANPVLEEKFVQRYVALSTVYAGLLMLGRPEKVKKSVQTLETLLLFYQQVPFKMKLDGIYTTLIMGNFALQDYEQVEKTFRRFKKTGKNKVLNEENDLTIQGFYYAAKFVESKKAQYAKKFAKVMDETAQKEGLKSTTKKLQEIATFFSISSDK